MNNQNKSSNRGGKREGAGRKSRSEEQRLIEKLTPLEPTALAALNKALKRNDGWAVKLFFNYMYGKPHQTVALEGGEKPIEISFED